MPGVLGILTADDVPQFPPPQPPILAKDEVLLCRRADPGGRGRKREHAAAEAIEAIKIDFQQLPACGRSARKPVPGRSQRALERQCRGRPDQAADDQMGRRRFRRGGRRQAADGQARRGHGPMAMSMPASRKRRSIDRGELRLRRAIRTTAWRPRTHLRLLARRQVLPVWLQPEPHRGRRQHLALYRHQAGRAGLHRGILRRRFRQQDPRLSQHGHRRVDVEEDQPAGDASHLPRRGIWDRQRAAELPGLHEARLRADGKLLAADLYIVQESGPTPGRRRFPRRRRVPVDGLSAGGDALSRRSGAHQYAVPVGPAARSRRKPVRRRDSSR